MKSKFILIIAFAMAVITTFLLRQYISGIESKFKGEQKKISIVVPKTDIKKNQRVTKDNFELKEFNAGSVHTDAVKKVEDIVGKYALIDMKAGEVLFADRFINEFEENKLITRKIKDGYRAVAIGVNYVESVANLIQPEDYVDIVYSFGDNTANKNVQTVTLFENVRVLSVGSRMIEKDSNNTNSNKTDQTVIEYTSITVELKPEDIVKLVNADEKGNIRFILRSKLAP
jgi:pilus assembly protein CpaB